jgi:hypothetical protein
VPVPNIRFSFIVTNNKGQLLKLPTEADISPEEDQERQKKTRITFGPMTHTFLPQ